jgi:hypothetical protein
MNRLSLALFNTGDLAEPLRKRLVESGIAAVIHSQLKLEKCWFVSEKDSGVRLEVPADQFEQAYNLLLTWDAADGALKDAVRCPECQAFRVEYPPVSQKSIIPNLVVGALAAIARVQREYYCTDCHYTWPKESDLQAEDRPNMAPNYFIEGIEEPSPRGAKGTS